MFVVSIIFVWCSPPSKPPRPKPVCINLLIETKILTFVTFMSCVVPHCLTVTTSDKNRKMVTTIVDCQAYQPRACIHPDIIRRIIKAGPGLSWMFRRHLLIWPITWGCLAWPCGLQEGRCSVVNNIVTRTKSSWSQVISWKLDTVRERERDTAGLGNNQWRFNNES